MSGRYGCQGVKGVRALRVSGGDGTADQSKPIGCLRLHARGCTHLPLSLPFPDLGPTKLGPEPNPRLPACSEGGLRASLLLVQPFLECLQIRGRVWVDGGQLGMDARLPVGILHHIHPNAPCLPSPGDESAFSLVPHKGHGVLGKGQGARGDGQGARGKG